MTDQLLIDLRKHTREKLFKWVQDTFDLFDMADLSEADAANVMFNELIRQIGIFASATRDDEQKIASAITDEIRRQRGLDARGKKKEKRP